MVRKHIAAAAAALALAAGACADEHEAGAAYHDAWGPAVGAPMAAISAADQHGDTRTLEDLAGARGLLLFMVRSADW